MSKWLALVASISVISGPLVVWSHENATGIVKERMELMKSLGQSMKTLGSVFRGQVDHDPATIEQAAKSIQSLSGSTMTVLFPEGSLHAPSEAAPAIWEDWVAFEDIAEESRIFSSALIAAANNPPSDEDLRLRDLGAAEPDPAALAEAAPQRAFAFLAKTCVDCHEAFRINKD